MNRIFKAAIATLVSALVIGLAIAYVPDLRVKTMLTFLRAANIVGLVDRDAVEEGRAAAQRGDFATALELWRPLAERGHAAAQNYLGEMYEKGKGVPQYYMTAVTWYRKAADQGNAIAQTNLGDMYDEGKGVQQDPAAAASWYRKAADQGNARLRPILGRCMKKAKVSRRITRSR